MRALSILQPWAWLIVHGHKPVENRKWSTTYRGPLLIHAGKRWGPEQRSDLANVRAMFPGLVVPDTFDLGCVVGVATVTDCVQHMHTPWFFGPFGFVLERARPFPKPVPFKGQLGFFEVPGMKVPVEHEEPCCLRCGSSALDTGWECTDCGYDCMPFYVGEQGQLAP